MSILVRPTSLSRDGSYHMDHDGRAAVARIIGHLRSVLSVVHGFRGSGFCSIPIPAELKYATGCAYPFTRAFGGLGEFDKFGCRAFGLIWNEGNGVEF